MDSETLLRSAGWHPGRNVDIAADLARIASLGFRVVPAAETFLREFSGIAILWETKPAPLVIDGGRAAQDIDPGWAEAYGAAIGTQLTPVGEYSNMTVYIDDRGDLWGGYDEEYGHRGSLRELVSSIFLESPRGFDRESSCPGGERELVWTHTTCCATLAGFQVARWTWPMRSRSSTVASVTRGGDSPR